MTALTTDGLREVSDRLAKGDVAALEVAFEAFAGVALAMAVRVLNNRAEAEEVVQESFVQIWKSATRYEPQRASLATWILSIVKSRAIDRLRANSTRHRVAESVQREASELSLAPSPDEHLHTQRSAQQVQGLLSALPVEQRQVLELAYFQGLSHREISTRTALPLGTVKTWVRRATMTLAELIKAEPH